MSLRLFVVCHGETEWSLSGQHTGRADILLSENGKVEARLVGERIRNLDFSNVLVSPLMRAKETCDLAELGTGATIEADLIEWDNGDYEGRTRSEILATRPGWNLFRDGCPNGEQPSQISDRVDRLIHSLRRLDGDVALFTHGHLGRVLAARWIGLSVEFAEHFLLDTASLSILCYQHDQPAISLWNSLSPEALDRTTKKSLSAYSQSDAAVLKRKALERWENEGGEIADKKTGASPVQSCSPILAINGGSSSIKFAIFQGDKSLSRSLYGKIDRIGFKDATFTFDGSNEQRPLHPIDATTHETATNFLIDWLDQKVGLKTISAIGHRVVHGMEHTAPEPVTQELLDDLNRIIPCDPQHLPCEIALIEAFRARLPKLPQFVCFDTGFHSTMPRVAKLLSLPRRFDRKGVQRYGFHGLSYEYLMQELGRIGDSAATCGCAILAHLGNGASLVAVRDGKSIDTSMGFTPSAGLPMSTRSGDLDPGIVGYLARTERMSVVEFERMVHQESGLIGVSETSSDMRDLIEKESNDIRAAEAVELFCYQTKKWIGAFMAALGGLQTLVFTGGVGENSSSVRFRICEGLKSLGIEIDKGRNDLNSEVISSEGSRVTVRVIRTDEEQMIAQSVHRMMEGKT